MKRYSILLLLLCCVLIGKAQVKLDDFGRIALNTYLPENLALTTEAKNFLSNKLSQITSNNGIAGSQINPRFIITANVSIGTTDIIAGPPHMIAQNLDITLFICDAQSNIVFSNLTLSVKGVSTNENKAFIEAIKNINPKNKDVIAFLDKGKDKIISYYITNCDFIIKEAQTLVKQQKYDEAIYQLALVPNVCQDCYFKCLDQLTNVYQQKIDATCKQKLNEARTTWAAAQNPNGAEKVGDILCAINPMASCQAEVNEFIKSIDTTLNVNEKAKWESKMKNYNDKIYMHKEQLRIVEEKDKASKQHAKSYHQRNYIILNYIENSH